MARWHITPHSLRRGIVFLLKIGIVLLTSAPFFIILTEFIRNPFYGRGNHVGMGLYAFLFIMLGIPYDAFKIGISRIRELIYSFTITILITNFIVYLILALMSRTVINPIPMIILIIGQIIVMTLYFFLANKIYYHIYPSRNTVIIHANTDYEKHIAIKFAYREDRYNIRAVLTQDDDFDSITKAIDENNTCILGQVNMEIRHKILNYCYDKNKRLFIMPTIDDIVMQNAHVTQIGDSLLYLIKNRPLSLEQLIIKRFIDIVLSLVFLLITSPILLLVSLLIKMTDGGPIFFKQERYTRNAETFDIIKFRSMIVDAEKDGAQFTVENDSRITSIGKIIRKTRIDEIPQFFNVLKGDMSIVGPRAERIENVDAYTNYVPEFAYRLKVKAGITGYAQIYGKYNTSPEDKARMDIHYIETFSLFNDIKLMMTTIKILFQEESTEGFKNEKK